MKKGIAARIALALIVLMFLGLISYVAYPVNATTTEDLNGDLSDLQEERERLEKELNKIEDKRDSELEKKTILDQQITAIQQQVDLEQKKLDILDDELEQATDKLDAATAAYKEAFKASKSRIRASYESGSVSYLQIIMSAKSITDFIMRLEVVREILAYDRAVIKQLSESKAQIEASRQTIADRQQQQEEATEALKEQRSSLAGKQKASEKLVQSFDMKSDSLIAQIEEMERQEAELRQQIQRQIAEENRKAAERQKNGEEPSIVISGSFQYPLDSKWKIITDPFGYRTHPITGVYKMHTGCDFTGSGIYGAPVYASKNGIVSKAGYHSAYGNYVVINHGDGSATLYGHMSSLATSADSSVQQGQVIGYVGSSGNSTGAHLHFEIMLDGEYVDPVPYFSSYINFIYY